MQNTQYRDGDLQAIQNELRTAKDNEADLIIENCKLKDKLSSEKRWFNFMFVLTVTFFIVASLSIFFSSRALYESRMNQNIANYELHKARILHQKCRGVVFLNQE